MTNHERIKQMSAEELAAALYAFNNCTGDCPAMNGITGNKKCKLECLYPQRIRDWLESKVIG